MREIKFRAWDNHGSMKQLFGIDEYSVYIDDMGPEDGIYGKNPTISRDSRSAWEIMQYTGLKDKNGVEIYEGDILRVSSNGFSNYISFKGENCAVEYGKNTLAFLGVNSAGVFVLNTDAEIRVIGNIYENPELLENK